MQQELGGNIGGDRRLRRQPGPQPVPAQRRQPDRSTSQIRTAPAPPRQIREFAIVERNADGTHRRRSRTPFAEIDYKTSGGHDSYNAMQLSLNRRSASGLSMNVQYTLGNSRGNTGGSNEATTAGNNARALAEFDYDNGYNNFDVRHTFNLSLLYTHSRATAPCCTAAAGTSAASSTRAAACRCRC